jgi:hypothetical protein
MTVGLVIALGLGELAVNTWGDLLPDPATFPTPEGQVKYNDLVVEGRDLEVVVLGSSSLEAAFDPAQVSTASAYNLAMPFTDLATMHLWLSEVVFAYTQPKVVLIGVLLWESSDQVSLGDALEKALADTGPPSFSRLLESRGSLALLDQRKARERLLTANHWTEDGHQTAYYEVEPTEEWPKLDAAVLSGPDRSSLLAVIDLVRSHDAEPVIVIEPLADSRIGDHEGTSEFLEEVNALASQADVQVWDLSSTMGEPDLYVDGLHVTREGATEFTRHIVDRLLLPMLAGSSESH